MGKVTLAKYTEQQAPQPHVLFEKTPTSIPEAVAAPVTNNLKPGSFVAIPVPTDRGRTVLYVASVCSVIDNQLQVKFLRNTGKGAGIYRDGEDEDVSLEDITNVLFVCPDPQVKMVGSQW